MTRNEFLQVNDRPCRFKLKSGKEFFGVIWESAENGAATYFFSTVGERFDPRKVNNFGVPVLLDDIVGAELINSSLVG